MWCLENLKLRKWLSLYFYCRALLERHLHATFGHDLEQLWLPGAWLAPGGSSVQTDCPNPPTCCSLSLACSSPAHLGIPFPPSWSPGVTSPGRLFPTPSLIHSQSVLCFPPPFPWAVYPVSSLRFKFQNCLPQSMSASLASSPGLPGIYCMNAGQ